MIDKIQFYAVAFIMGSALGGCFGSMGAHHLAQGLAIGGAAGVGVAWLILLRETNAKGS